MRDQLSVCILLLALELIGCNCFETAFRTQTKNPSWDESPLSFKLISWNSPPPLPFCLFPFCFLSLCNDIWKGTTWLSFVMIKKKKNRYTFCEPKLIQIRAIPTACGNYSLAQFLNFIISTWYSVFTF